MKPTIQRGDLIDYLRAHEWLVQNGYIQKAHAVLCDPPYFLGSIVKRFGGKQAAAAKYGTDGIFQRSSAGFMGQTWDGFEDVYQYQQWVTEWGRLLLSYVYPGAVLLAFGGTRTYHRMAAGLEDAGWIVADSLMWTYGNGFPKSHDISKAIDKAAGAEREVVGRKIYPDGKSRKQGTTMHEGWDRPWRKNEPQKLEYETAPATDAARQWDGYGTALKPAYEPILLCRAPFPGTYAQTAQQYGTGAINVDGGRIGASSKPRKDPRNGNLVNAHMEMRPWMERRIAEGKLLKGDFKGDQGRWPSNLLLGCACESDAHDESCPVRVMGEQSGVTGNGYRANGSQSKDDYFGLKNGPVGARGHDDSGDASRFFYCAKSSKWEREAGLHNRARVTVNDGRNTPIDNPYQRGGKPALKIREDLPPEKKEWLRAELKRRGIKPCS